MSKTTSTLGTEYQIILWEITHRQKEIKNNRAEDKSNNKTTMKTTGNIFLPSANGHTQKIYDKIIKFTGKIEKGEEKDGIREIDEASLVYLLGDFEQRIDAIEEKLKLK